MKMICNAFILSFACIISISLAYDTSTLQLVHVLFRHGNRTVDRDAGFPLDPHINETFYPYGYGALTNKGKVKEYRVGRALRLRYNDFLGDVYTPDVLDVLSSNYNRTKMSAELVLAGLYPPKDTPLDWENNFNWQPIPYNYASFPDHLLVSPLYNCPNYIKLYEEFLNSSLAEAIRRRYKPLFDYLSFHTGLNITTNLQVLILYTTLAAEEDWGFELPVWTRTVWPRILNRAGGEEFFIGTFTPQMRQLSGGFLLKKMIKDTHDKITGTLVPNGRKLFMYSAHDTTIGYFLGSLKLLFSWEPPFSAYILVEVHKIDGVYGLKIFYQDYIESNPMILTVPGCQPFCPLEDFVRLLNTSFPEDGDPCGNETHHLKSYKQHMQRLGF